jgi:hypothetical protein
LVKIYLLATHKKGAYGVSRRPDKILTNYCSVILIIFEMEGKVVKALGFGTREMGAFSTNGVPARLNCVKRR